MCELYAEDYADVWRRSWHRARRDRRCGVCWRTIRQGEHYEVTFVVSDGSADSCSSCAQCAGTIQLFGEAHNFWPFPESFVEYLRECVRDLDGARWMPFLELIEARIRGHA